MQNIPLDQIAIHQIPALRQQTRKQRRQLSRRQLRHPKTHSTK